MMAQQRPHQRLSYARHVATQVGAAGVVREEASPMKEGPLSDFSWAVGTLSYVLWCGGSWMRVA